MKKANCCYCIIVSCCIILPHIDNIHTPNAGEKKKNISSSSSRSSTSTSNDENNNTHITLNKFTKPFVMVFVVDVWLFSLGRAFHSPSPLNVSVCTQRVRRVATLALAMSLMLLKNNCFHIHQWNPIETYQNIQSFGSFVAFTLIFCLCSFALYVWIETNPLDVLAIFIEFLCRIWCDIKPCKLTSAVKCNIWSKYQACTLKVFFTTGKYAEIPMSTHRTHVQIVEISVFAMKKHLPHIVNGLIVTGFCLSLKWRI